MKILIAEDDKTSRQLLAAFLAGCGPVDVTVDGSQALDAFRRAWTLGHPYDLICLDIMMPVMDGHEALRAIRSEEKQRGVEERERVKVIMTTALSDEKNKNTALEAGCEAYLNKPIDRREILNTIRELNIFDEKTAG